MTEQLQGAEEAEVERERTFRVNEDERQRMYLEREARRDEEARQHREAILQGVDQQVQDRLASIPTEPAIPVPPPGTIPHEEPAPEPEPEPVPVPEPQPELPVEEELLAEEEIPAISPEPYRPSRTPELQEPEADGCTLAQDIQTQVIEAIRRHGQDIMETINLEREEMAASRAETERIRAELNAEREQRIADMNTQNNALREEIANLKAANEQLKNDLEQERQLRITEDTVRRESERGEDRQRADDLATQLSEVTDIVSGTRDDVIRKREVSDERWAQKETWHTECNVKMDDMKSMLEGFQRMFEDEQRARQAEREEQASRPRTYGITCEIICYTDLLGKPGVEDILAQLREENNQLRTLLQELSDGE